MKKKNTKDTRTSERNGQIVKCYEQMTNDGVKPKQAVSDISESFGIGEFYVKSILKLAGIKPNFRDSSAKLERDAKIFELYMNETDIADIAAAVGVTPTRVGQIIRDGLGERAKDEVLEKTLDQIKEDVNSGMSHKDIVQKYGASVARKVKTNLGYNIFEACTKKRNDQIIAMQSEGKTAIEIANVFGLTRDHVYGILGTNGIKRRPSRAEYNARNLNIVKAFQSGKTSQQLAELYNMTVTNINIILKNQGVRD